jgi:hypothetical protein
MKRKIARGRRSYSRRGMRSWVWRMRGGREGIRGMGIEGRVRGRERRGRRRNGRGRRRGRRIRIWRRPRMKEG